MKFPFYKFTLNLIADLCIAFGIQTSHAFAQTERDAEQASAPIVNSAMDGELFFKILLGELSLLDDKPRDAYALILDSAKKSKDEQLFERAMGIALQARAGESALTVAKAWRVALPDSLDARMRMPTISTPVKPTLISLTSLLGPKALCTSSFKTRSPYLNAKKQPIANTRTTPPMINNQRFPEVFITISLGND